MGLTLRPQSIPRLDVSSMAGDMGCKDSRTGVARRLILAKHPSAAPRYSQLLVGLLRNLRQDAAVYPPQRRKKGRDRGPPDFFHGRIVRRSPFNSFGASRQQTGLSDVYRNRRHQHPPKYLRTGHFGLAHQGLSAELSAKSSAREVERCCCARCQHTDCRRRPMPTGILTLCRADLRVKPRNPGCHQPPEKREAAIPPASTGPATGWWIGKPLAVEQKNYLVRALEGKGKLHGTPRLNGSHESISTHQNAG